MSYRIDTKRLVQLATESSDHWPSFHFTAEEMAQFLASIMTADVLQRARDIVIGKELDELQEQIASPDDDQLCERDEGLERAHEHERQFCDRVSGAG